MQALRLPSSSCPIAKPPPRPNHLDASRRLASAHLRDGDALKSVLRTARRSSRGRLSCSNPGPPVTTVAAAGAYRQRILTALPEGASLSH